MLCTWEQRIYFVCNWLDLKTLWICWLFCKQAHLGNNSAPLNCSHSSTRWLIKFSWLLFNEGTVWPVNLLGVICFSHSFVVFMFYRQRQEKGNYMRGWNMITFLMVHGLNRWFIWNPYIIASCNLFSASIKFY